MKKLIILILLSMCGVWVKGQTIQFSKHGSFEVTQWKSSQPIFRFYMSNDTAVLKPIDTTYSVADGLAFQAIRYAFKEGKKDMELTLKNYNNGYCWIFRSVEVKPQPYLILSGISSSGTILASPLFFHTDSRMDTLIYPKTPTKPIKKK